MSSGAAARIQRGRGRRSEGFTRRREDAEIGELARFLVFQMRTASKTKLRKRLTRPRSASERQATNVARPLGAALPTDIRCQKTTGSALEGENRLGLARSIEYRNRKRTCQLVISGIAHSQNFEQVIRHVRPHAFAQAYGDDLIEPCMRRGRRLEERRDAQIVGVAVHRLAARKARI